MQDLSLHILDIAENAVRAGARTVTVRVLGDEASDALTLTIVDDGEGMDSETAGRARDPFFSTKADKKTGLGLSLLGQAAEDTGGQLLIASEQGKGTVVTAVFRNSHPDMKPLGDLMETFASLIAGSPGVRFVLDYRLNGGAIHFDSKKTSEEADA